MRSPAELISPFSSRVRLSLAGRGDARLLQACLDDCADYFERTDGALMAEGAALDLLAEAEADPDRRLVLVLTEKTRRPIGLFDLYLHHGERGLAHIGLFLLVPGARGKGLGREATEALERMLSQEGFCVLRASVVNENPQALTFWEGLGFAKAGRLNRGITVLEKPI